MFSVLSQAHILRAPTEWKIQNFCDVIFHELDKNPSLEAYVTEIRHYKEQDNLEHEFLLAFVTHAQKSCVLRLERTTPPRQQISLFQKLAQTSTSILPALDMVRVSSSKDQLTLGMGRGPSIPVVTLPFSSGTTFALRELCLILSFFPTFSPEYKLKEEQCYWFCDVVLSTVRASCKDIPIVKEKGFNRAGKFGGFSVQNSATTRKLFVDAYSIVRTLGQNFSLDELSSVTLTQETVGILVSILTVQSSEARTRAVIALTRLASELPSHRQMVAEAKIVPKLISIIPDASQLKVHILASLHAHINNPVLCGLEAANVDMLTQFLSLFLSSTDEDTHKKAVSMLCMIVSVGGTVCASPGPSSSTASSIGCLWKILPHTQLAALEAIIPCFDRNPQLITDNVLFPSFNIISPMATTKTRRQAIIALTGLVEQLLVLDRFLQTPFPTHAKRFSEEVVTKFVSLSMDDNASIRETVSQGLSELAKYTELCTAIATANAIPQSVQQRRSEHRTPDVRYTGDNVLRKPAKNFALHGPRGNAIPWVLQLLVSERSPVRVAGATAIAKLADHAELHAPIKNAIPKLFGLLNDDKYDVLVACTNAIVKLAGHTELRAAINNAIPKLFRLLDNKYDILIVGINTIVKLANHTELLVAIATVIPKVFSLLESNTNSVRTASAAAVAKLAKLIGLQAAIEDAILWLPQLFVNENLSVRIVGIEVVVAFASHRQLHNAIGNIIPKLIKLLRDSDSIVRITAAIAIKKLARHAKLCAAIGTGIPTLFRSLKDNNNEIRTASASAIAELAKHTGLYPAIGNAILWLPQLFLHQNWAIRVAGANLLVELATHPKLRTAIRDIIPELIKLLRDDNNDVRVTGANVIAGFARHSELLITIKDAIMKIFELVFDEDDFVRAAGTNAIGRLAKYPELHTAIGDAIPGLNFQLLRGNNNIQLTCANVITKLAEHTHLLASIKITIPHLLRLLMGNDDVVRVACANTIAILAEHTELHTVIGHAIALNLKAM